MKQNEDCTIGMDRGLRNTKEIKKWAKECGRSGGTVHYLPLRKPDQMRRRAVWPSFQLNVLEYQ